MTQSNQAPLKLLTQVVQAGSRSSLASFVQASPHIAVDMARLVAPKTPAGFDDKGNRTVSRPSATDLKQISAKVAQQSEDAQAVIQLFSDVKIAAEILISSIRSPNDMYEGEVLFDLKDNLHVSPLSSKLLPLVRTYFADVYPLADKFEDILRGTLFGAGSYPILVLPENSLTDIISGHSNMSTETFAGVMHADGYPVPTGLLGPADNDTDRPKTALERINGLMRKRPNPGNRCLEFGDANHKITCHDIVILDNPIELQMPLMSKIAQESAVNQMRGNLGTGGQKMTDRDLATLLYRRTTGREDDFVKIKTDKELKRYSVGRPLILDLPPESVVPVINRGRPDDPIGYIVVLDADGAPLSRMTETSQFDALKKTAKNSQPGGNGGYGDMSSYLLQKAASNFGYNNCEEVTLRQVNKVFAEILEADLSARFRNGVWGTEVTVSSSERLAELMLYRVMSQKRTQLMFVPAEMMTYFSYQVNENGTGRNLLQDSLVISAMRAQVLFARVLGAVKNSIGRTKVDVQIDPDEQDSVGMYNMIQSEVIAARQTLTTPNSVNPTDVLNQIQAANIEFQVTGAKGLPETHVEFSEVASSYVRPDDELMKELADLMINHIGVPPEMVEEARRPDFATVAIANNVLFSKRVRHMQQRYDPQNTHLVISMLMADTTFIIELKKVIAENLQLVTDAKLLHEDIDKLKDNPVALVDLLCSEFISNLRASLARPDLKSIENNLEALAKHKEMIEEALNACFSADAVDASTIGEMAMLKLEGVKKAAKAALIRKFLVENNMAMDVFDLISTDEDGVLSHDLKAEVVQHSSAVAKVMLALSTQLTRTAAASDLEHQQLVETSDATASADSDFSTDTGDSTGGEDDGFGMGEFSDIPSY